eukprot:6181807-Pleurochrysis_carterae.AAC.3
MHARGSAAANACSRLRSSHETSGTWRLSARALSRVTRQKSKKWSVCAHVWGIAPKPVSTMWAIAMLENRVCGSWGHCQSRASLTQPHALSTAACASGVTLCRSPCALVTVAGIILAT